VDPASSGDRASHAWQPLYSGADADELRDVVRAIAFSIAAGAGEPRSPTDLALFWAYAAGELEDDRVQAEYDAAIAALTRWIVAGASGPGLHGGLAGAGWVLAHVSEPGAAEPALEVIDRALLSRVEHWPPGSGYDLISGVVGLAVYFLERLRDSPAPLARRGLEQIVEQLGQTCHRSADGAAWHTRPELLPDWQRERWPGGYYDCGVAHGVAGVAAVLGKIAAAPAPPRDARELCMAGLAWLEARRGPPGAAGRYPSMVAPPTAGATGARSPARAAWCYGDPGVIAAQWTAWSSLGAPTATEVDAALTCLDRPIASSGVVDPGLCHGALGLAHLFNRFYQASRDQRFAAAARAWVRRGLDMRRPGGVGGFEAMVEVDHGAPPRWLPSADFLGGAAGIGLALLAVIRGDEPGWDRLLLCDVPPAG